MFRRVLLLLSVFAVLSPVPTSRAEGEKVIVEATVETLPRRDSDLCMTVDPGVLTATVQGIGPGLAPVRFVMGGTRNDDSPQVNTMVASAPVTYSIPTVAGLYCFDLYNSGFAPENIVLGELRRYAQMVALRIVWAPPAP